MVLSRKFPPTPSLLPDSSSDHTVEQEIQLHGCYLHLDTPTKIEKCKVSLNKAGLVDLLIILQSVSKETHIYFRIFVAPSGGDEKCLLIPKYLFKIPLFICKVLKS